MYLAYYDEAGDDGYPKYSSPLFVLSCVYVHQDSWQSTYAQLCEFRRRLNTDFRLSAKTELHTKHFLLNKNPYRKLGLSDGQRVLVLDHSCDFMNQLPVKVVNVVINKTAIRLPDYPVLDRALTYSIQRIENDLRESDPEEKFLVITDPGRLGKMQKTSRRIQRINFIPSKFHTGSYRREIQCMVEDPLPKDSAQSYFIQMADMLTCMIYLYCLASLSAGAFHNRMPDQVDAGKVTDWLSRLKGIINLKAAKSHPYGIVIYPK